MNNGLANSSVISKCGMGIICLALIKGVKMKYDLDYILELERKNSEDNLKAKLQKAKDENRQNTINLCVFIAAEQMKVNTFAAFGLIKQQ